MFLKANSMGASPAIRGWNLAPNGRGGFTLVELLVVLTVIALLAALLLPALSRSKHSARATQCLNQMRQLGVAVRLYVDENGDSFPRSQHSAFANGELPWERSVAPMLGSSTVNWTNLLLGLYHCPVDTRSKPWSYGLNVYYELGAGDDYTGKPQTWRHLAQVPHPSATVLFAENNSSADHLMPQYWYSQADAVDLAGARHSGRANYNFADGHASLLRVNSIYNPPQLDPWNPLLAQ